MRHSLRGPSPTRSGFFLKTFQLGQSPSSTGAPPFVTVHWNGNHSLNETNRMPLCISRLRVTDPHLTQAQIFSYSCCKFGHDLAMVYGETLTLLSTFQMMPQMMLTDVTAKVEILTSKRTSSYYLTFQPLCVSSAALKKRTVGRRLADVLPEKPTHGFTWE